MSIQDKLERILKEIHIVLAEGETLAEDMDKVIVDKKEVLGILQRLNQTVYEMMEQYEVTTQSRELAQRRSEKKGEELLTKIEQQTEDIYAASLIYTEDAMNRVSHLMANALESSKKIFQELYTEIEREQYRVKDDQLELREQLQDFKDAKKYLMILEECNKEREKEQQDKNSTISEKRIQNEAKHYAMNEKPEIKINPTYFQRKKLIEEDKQDIEKVMSEVKVNLDAEYFKWQSDEEANSVEVKKNKGIGAKREHRSLFGKWNKKESE